MARRTVMYSRGGKKLYAVRDKSGKFKDIQQYARAHRMDIQRGSTKTEAAVKAKSAAKKAAKKAASSRAKTAVKRATKKTVAKRPAKKAAKKTVRRAAKKI